MYFHRKRKDPMAGEWIVEAGATRVLALAMFAAGSLVLALLIWPELLPISLPPDLMAYLGLFLFKGGLLAFFSVSGLTVDRRAGAIFHWVRVLGLRALETRSKVADLEEAATGIRVEHDPLDLLVTKRHAWILRLLPGPQGGQPIERFGTPLEALAMARSIAEFLSVPIADATMGPERQIDPLDFHAPLGRVLRRREAKVVPGEVPTPRRFEVHDDTRSFTLDLPPGGLRTTHIVSVALGGLLSMLFFLWLRPLAPGQDLATMVLRWLIVLWPLPLPLAVALVATRQWTRIVIDDEGLRSTRPWASLHWTRRLPARDLRDLLLLAPCESNPARGLVFPSDAMIVARSEGRCLRFGAGLSWDELRWIHGSCENAVARYFPE